MVLEYEWLELVGELSSATDYCRHLARVHTLALRLPRDLARLVRQMARPGDGVPAPLARAAPGLPADGFTWTCILDHKKGHTGYRRGTGEAAQLDLEAITFGLSGLLDLAATPSLLDLDFNGSSWRSCVRAYVAEAQEQGLPLECENIMSGIHAVLIEQNPQGSGIGGKKHE